MANRIVLTTRPLERLALAYLTQAREKGELYDSVATFHLSNGAWIEKINASGNLRPYGLKDSFGATVNYRYLVAELEENHERSVRGEIQVLQSLASEFKSCCVRRDQCRCRLFCCPGRLRKYGNSRL